MVPIFEFNADQCFWMPRHRVAKRKADFGSLNVLSAQTLENSIAKLKTKHAYLGTCGLKFKDTPLEKHKQAIRRDILQKLQSEHLTRQANLTQQIIYWDVMPYELELENGKVYAQCRLRLNANTEFWMFLARRYYRDADIHLISDITISKQNGCSKAVKHECVRTTKVSDCPSYLKMPDKIAKFMLAQPDRVHVLVDKYAFLSVTLSKSKTKKSSSEPAKKSQRMEKMSSPKVKAKSSYASAFFPRNMRKRAGSLLMHPKKSKSAGDMMSAVQNIPVNRSDSAPSKPDLHDGHGDDESGGETSSGIGGSRMGDRQQTSDISGGMRPQKITSIHRRSLSSSPIKKYKAMKLSQLKAAQQKQLRTAISGISNGLKNAALQTPPSSEKSVSSISDT